MFLRDADIMTMHIDIEHEMADSAKEVVQEMDVFLPVRNMESVSVLVGMPLMLLLASASARVPSL